MIDHINKQCFEYFLLFVDKNGYNGVKNLADLGDKYPLIKKQIETFNNRKKLGQSRQF